MTSEIERERLAFIMLGIIAYLTRPGHSSFITVEECLYRLKELGFPDVIRYVLEIPYDEDFPTGKPNTVYDETLQYLIKEGAIQYWLPQDFFDQFVQLKVEEVKSGYLDGDMEVTEFGGDNYIISKRDKGLWVYEAEITLVHLQRLCKGWGYVKIENIPNDNIITGVYRKLPKVQSE